MRENTCHYKKRSDRSTESRGTKWALQATFMGKAEAETGVTVFLQTAVTVMRHESCTLTLRTDIGAFISVSVSKMSVSDLDISDCAYRMFMIIGKLAEWCEEFRTCNEIHSARTMQSLFYSSI